MAFQSAGLFSRIVCVIYPRGVKELRAAVALFMSFGVSSRVCRTTRVSSYELRGIAVVRRPLMVDVILPQSPSASSLMAEGIHCLFRACKTGTVKFPATSRKERRFPSEFFFARSALRMISAGRLAASNGRLQHCGLSKRESFLRGRVARSA
jgi:hypothetical protein